MVVFSSYNPIPPGPKSGCGNKSSPVPLLLLLITPALLLITPALLFWLEVDEPPPSPPTVAVFKKFKILATIPYAATEIIKATIALIIIFLPFSGPFSESVIQRKAP